jgi:hypothetical protein
MTAKNPLAWSIACPFTHKIACNAGKSDLP